ncbi:MAG: HEAT repeat domain-containing protein, partial [Anaerolineae bacterium]|nr:HEAT repeat domain-containing protein [Anaerolineae bacterium]
MSKERTDQELTTLLDRFRNGFINGTLTLAEGTEIINRLRAFDAAAIHQIAHMLAAPDRETRYTGITLARELGDDRLVPPLRKILRDPNRNDEEKVLAAIALADLGAPVDEATFRRAVSDPNAVMKQAMEHTLSTIGEPEQAESFLGLLERWPAERQSRYIHDVLAPLADRRLLLLLNALLYSAHDEVVVAAIDAIERLKEPAYIPLLEERAAYDPSPRVRHAAENAALRLNVRVGSPESVSTPPPWSARSELPLACCLLSTLDGSGTQVLLLGRYLPQGEIRLVDILFNDHQGCLLYTS